jgi:hypothetical protein
MVTLSVCLSSSWEGPALPLSRYTVKAVGVLKKPQAVSDGERAR